MMRWHHEIERLSRDHCAALGPHLRQCDKEELWAAHHFSDMTAVLLQCRLLSFESFAWVVNGQVHAAFGVAQDPNFNRVARPWLLGTEAIGRHPEHILRVSRRMIELWRKDWALLENWVDARNEVSIRWLKRLGFELDDAAPWGADGLPFHRFEMKGDRYV